MSTLKSHPLYGLMPPRRIADYANHCRMYWFKEMVRGHTNSSGEWEWDKLGICPATGKLMYMNGYFPIGWNIIDNVDAWEKLAYDAYGRFLVENHLLGDG